MDFYEVVSSCDSCGEMKHRVVGSKELAHIEVGKSIPMAYRCACTPELHDDNAEYTDHTVVSAEPFMTAQQIHARLTLDQSDAWLVRLSDGTTTSTGWTVGGDQMMADAARILFNDHLRQRART